jgi:hypothetical protein
LHLCYLVETSTGSKSQLFFNDGGSGNNVMLTVPILFFRHVLSPLSGRSVFFLLKRREILSLVGSWFFLGTQVKRCLVQVFFFFFKPHFLTIGVRSEIKQKFDENFATNFATNVLMYTWILIRIIKLSACE